MREKLAGRTMTAADAKEYVLVATPCYLFKAALRSLETADPKGISILAAPVGRKTGKFPDEILDEIRIRFGPKPLF